MAGQYTSKTIFPILLCTVLLILFLVFFKHIPRFSNSRQLVDYILSFGTWTIAVSILIMAMQTVFTPVPLILVAGAYGFIFGVFRGVLITMTGAMAGTVIAFFLARLFKYSFIPDGFGRADRFQMNGLSAGEMPRVVFMARLLPVLPASIVSYMAGLSKISFRSFFLVSCLGFLPEVILYAFLGHSLNHARMLTCRVTIFLILITTLYFLFIIKKYSNIFAVKNKTGT